jgi:hypothetical protein
MLGSFAKLGSGRRKQSKTPPATTVEPFTFTAHMSNISLKACQPSQLLICHSLHSSKAIQVSILPETKNKD